jgi:hypothetical protein
LARRWEIELYFSEQNILVIPADLLFEDVELNEVAYA